jgi:cysteinyl-tRNA synthetase
MANVWMHNGFLQVEGEKMSKSLGNFITIHELLATRKFGANRWHGRVIRLAMLGTHYRQPIDWTAERLLQARAMLSDFADLLSGTDAAAEPNADVVAALSDDLNTPSALSIVHGLAKSARRNREAAAELRKTLEFMGLYEGETRDAFNVGVEKKAVDADKVEALVAARLAARKAKDFKESDRLRDELAAMGVTLKDAKDAATGDIVTTWELAR